MVKEEVWSIVPERAEAFFQSQPDVTREGRGRYRFGSCAITLTEMKPKGMGIWAAKRIRVRMQGEEADVEDIYHRFLLQFLSTGG